MENKNYPELLRPEHLQDVNAIRSPEHLQDVNAIRSPEHLQDVNAIRSPEHLQDVNAIRSNVKATKYNVKGQALVEYALLLLFIVGMAVLVSGPVSKLLAKMEEPLRRGFKLTYKYGDPRSCGFDDDIPCFGPAKHALIRAPDNYRIFGRKAR